MSDKAKKIEKTKKNPIQICKEQGGYLRMSEALKQGITRYMLYALRDKGLLEQVSRGVYRPAELPSLHNPDLVTVALRYPRAVICLTSALAFHGITTQIPHSVSAAIPRNSHITQPDFPPITVHRFSDTSYRAGIQEHTLDGATVQIYNPEKTLVDCFKFRNTIGMDIVLEAFQLYRERMPFDHAKILTYAKVCRVQKQITPYLEVFV